MLCGRLPFDDEYIPTLFKKINGKYIDLLRNDISAASCAKPMLAKCRRHLYYSLVFEPRNKILADVHAGRGPPQTNHHS